MRKYKECILDAKEVDHIVSEWKSRLRLDGWNVTVSFDDLAGFASSKGCSIDGGKRGRIILCTPESYSSEYGDPYNMEYEIVWNFLAFKLRWFEPQANTQADLVFKQMITDLAEGLLESKHNDPLFSFTKNTNRDKERRDDNA